MARAALMAMFLWALPVGDLVEAGALRSDTRRIAAAEAGPARRGLFRRRSARANRAWRTAQSFPVDADDHAAELPPGAAVLEATPAVSQVPHQETEVWPQAAALFPAE
jgi:hypothetical protein